MTIERDSHTTDSPSALTSGYYKDRGDRQRNTAFCFPNLSASPVESRTATTLLSTFPPNITFSNSRSIDVVTVSSKRASSTSKDSQRERKKRRQPDYPSPTLLLPPLLRVPAEIRLLIFDILLKRLQQRVYNRRPKDRGVLALRYLNRQIGEETFPYLLRKFDVGWHLTQCRKNNDFEYLTSIIAGRWEKILEFETVSDYAVGTHNVGWVGQRVVETSLPGGTVDATGLRAAWDTIGWPLGERKVRSLTILQAQRIGSLGVTEQLLLWLALLACYFPELRELRMAFMRGGPFMADTRVEREWYKIEGDEVREWDSEVVRWTLPRITFREVGGG